MTSLEHQFRVNVHTKPGYGVVEFVLYGLSEYPAVGGQVVKPAQGTTATSPVEVKVADLSGELTARLSKYRDGFNRMDLVGRVCEVQRSENGGVHTTISVARLAAISDTPKVGEYSVKLSDERWVERRFTLWEGQADTCAVYPPYYLHYWGVNPPSGPANCKVVKTYLNYSKVQFWGGPGISTDILDFMKNDLKDQQEGGDGADHERRDGLGNFNHLRLRVNGVSYPIISFDGKDKPENTFTTSLAQVKPGAGVLFHVWIWGGNPTGQGYIWAPTADPSEVLPLHIGTLDVIPGVGSHHEWGYTAIGQNVWVIVKKILDHLGERYDPVALQKLIDSWEYPMMKWRITKPITDISTWLEDEIYGPLQVMPFIDNLGRVKLTSVALPHATTTGWGQAKAFDLATAFVFNDTNLVSPPTWDHTSKDLANAVSFTLPVFAQAGLTGGMAGQQLSSPSQPSHVQFPCDWLIPGEITREKEYDNTAEVGKFAIDFTLNGFPILPLGLVFQDLFTPEGEEPLPLYSYMDEKLSRSIFQRYGDGPIRGRMISTRKVQDGQGRTPEGVQPGDIVLINATTYPNAEIRARGGFRMVQIMSRVDGTMGILWEYLDVGPALQPLGTPTITLTSYAGDPYHSCVINVSNVPINATASVEIAVGGDVPFTRNLENLGNGSYRLRQLPSGTLIKAYVQAHAPGRISSPHSPAASFTTQTLSPPVITTADISVLGWVATVPFVAAHDTYWIQPVHRVAGFGSFYNTTVWPIPPRSSFFPFVLLQGSRNFDVGFKTVDRYGGSSPVGYETVTTEATPKILLQPRRLQVIQGRTEETIIPPSQDIVGYGLEVSWHPTEIHAETRVQMSTSEDFGIIESEFLVGVGSDRVHVFTGALDDQDRYVRLQHEREGFNSSGYSAEVVVAKPTGLLPFPVPDSFAGGSAWFDEREGHQLEVNVDHGADPDTDRVYWDYVVTDEEPEPGADLPYPDLVTEDEGGGPDPLAPGYPDYETYPPQHHPSQGKLLRTDLPYSEVVEMREEALLYLIDPVANDPPDSQLVFPGQIVWGTFEFWNKDKGWGQTTLVKWRVPGSSLWAEIASWNWQPVMIDRRELPQDDHDYLGQGSWDQMLEEGTTFEKAAARYWLDMDMLVGRGCKSLRVHVMSLATSLHIKDSGRATNLRAELQSAAFSYLPAQTPAYQANKAQAEESNDLRYEYHGRITTASGGAGTFLETLDDQLFGLPRYIGDKAEDDVAVGNIYTFTVYGISTEWWESLGVEDGLFITYWFRRPGSAWQKAREERYGPDYYQATHIVNLIIPGMGAGAQFGVHWELRPHPDQTTEEQEPQGGIQSGPYPTVGWSSEEQTGTVAVQYWYERGGVWNYVSQSVLQAGLSNFVLGATKTLPGGLLASDRFGMHLVETEPITVSSFTPLPVTWTTENQSDYVLYDPTKAWVVNEWQNYEVRIMAGHGAGQARVIESNTADSLRVTVAWSVIPDGTSTYWILKTNVGEEEGTDETVDFYDLNVLEDFVHRVRLLDGDIHEAEVDGNLGGVGTSLPFDPIGYYSEGAGETLDVELARSYILTVLPFGHEDGGQFQGELLQGDLRTLEALLPGESGSGQVMENWPSTDEWFFNPILNAPLFDRRYGGEQRLRPFFQAGYDLEEIQVEDDEGVIVTLGTNPLSVLGVQGLVDVGYADENNESMLTHYVETGGSEGVIWETPEENEDVDPDEFQQAIDDELIGEMLTWRPDYRMGPVQKIMLGGDLFILPPKNIRSGETLHLQIETNEFEVFWPQVGIQFPHGVAPRCTGTSWANFISVDGTNIVGLVLLNIGPAGVVELSGGAGGGGGGGNGGGTLNPFEKAMTDTLDSTDGGNWAEEMNVQGTPAEFTLKDIVIEDDPDFTESFTPQTEGA